ncbi:MAG: helix-turn-helix domain-containing protein [Pyrinomonadaceae bacterium]
MRDRMVGLIQEMLDGQILLGEAMGEFEKLYIQKALERSGNHLTKTAIALGIHRNTLSKRVAAYSAPPKPPKRIAARRSK